MGFCISVWSWRLITGSLDGQLELRTLDSTSFYYEFSEYRETNEGINLKYSKYIIRSLLNSSVINKTY